MPDYYSGWESEVFHCSNCEWTGTGVECDEGEMFSELFELDCSNCGKNLTVITYPTIEESRANWDKVSEADKQMIKVREEFVRIAESKMLKSPEELPDLEGDVLILVWDHVYDTNTTTIRYGNKIVWREPAFYEGYDRFEEVVEILKSKYGERLKDVAPAMRSGNYLFGDRISAPAITDEIRDQVWQGEKLDAAENNGNKNVSEANIEWEEAQIIVTFPQLQSSQQLPDINGNDDVLLVWDEEKKQRQILIRFGNERIWKETCFLRCSDRFESIAKILQQKYGSRLKDVIPTRNSEISLYKSQKNAELLVNKVRGNIWMSQYISPPEFDSIEKNRVGGRTVQQE